jgi:cell shape-determining protein MreC
VRDRNGQPVVDNKLVVTEFTVVYQNSGAVASLMTSKYRGDETFDNLKAITVGDVEDPDQIGIRSGDFRIPWGENSEWSQLRLTSTGVRPMSILEIEWRGQAFKRGRQ